MLTRTDIEAALALAPLGQRSDFDLNPSLRPEQMPGAAGRLANPATARPAAVLCGMVERAGALHVVLTERAGHLKHHAGQISFPGGKVDPVDRSDMGAALREAEEEIGLRAPQVEVIGALDPYYTVTNFRVTPFVGMIDMSWSPVLDPNEVADVFEAPLDFLMMPENCVRDFYDRDGQRRFYYAMPWQGRYIWGATAGMLKGLSDRLEMLRAGARP